MVINAFVDQATFIWSQFAADLAYNGHKLVFSLEPKADCDFHVVFLDLSPPDAVFALVCYTTRPIVFMSGQKFEDFRIRSAHAQLPNIESQITEVLAQLTKSGN